MELAFLFGVLLIGIAGVSLSIYGKYRYAPKRDNSAASQSDERD